MIGPFIESIAELIQDIELVLIRILSGGWKVIYRVDQRWVKNNRDPENTVYGPFQSHLRSSKLTILCLGRYGASTSQHGTLLYDDTTDLSRL